MNFRSLNTYATGQPGGNPSPSVITAPRVTGRDFEATLKRGLDIPGDPAVALDGP